MFRIMILTRARCSLAALGLVISASFPTFHANANFSAFPFGKKLVLIAEPVPGANLQPTLTVGTDSKAGASLWCNHVGGLSADVSDTQIWIERTKMTVSTMMACGDQADKADRELLSILNGGVWLVKDRQLTVSKEGREISFRIEDL